MTVDDPNRNPTQQQQQIRRQRSRGGTCTFQPQPNLGAIVGHGNSFKCHMDVGDGACHNGTFGPQCSNIDCATSRSTRNGACHAVTIPGSDNAGSPVRVHCDVDTGGDNSDVSYGASCHNMVIPSGHATVDCAGRGSCQSSRDSPLDRIGSAALSTTTSDATTASTNSNSSNAVTTWSCRGAGACAQVALHGTSGNMVCSGPGSCAEVMAQSRNAQLLCSGPFACSNLLVGSASPSVNHRHKNHHHHHDSSSTNPITVTCDGPQSCDYMTLVGVGVTVDCRQAGSCAHVRIRGNDPQQEHDPISSTTRLNCIHPESCPVADNHKANHNNNSGVVMVNCHPKVFDAHSRAGSDWCDHILPTLQNSQDVGKNHKLLHPGMIIVLLILLSFICFWYVRQCQRKMRKRVMAENPTRESEDDLNEEEWDFIKESSETTMTTCTNLSSALPGEDVLQSAQIYDA